MSFIGPIFFILRRAITERAFFVIYYCKYTQNIRRKRYSRPAKANKIWVCTQLIRIFAVTSKLFIEPIRLLTFISRIFLI